MQFSSVLSRAEALEPQGPQHTYYYLVVIIVAGKKMQEREMKYTFNNRNP